MDFNNKVMETLTAITENNEEDKQDLANLKQSLIDGTFNVKYLTWAIMATNDENGNRIIDTYATIERLTQVLEALTQEISDRKAADDLEKKERKEETSAIINSVNQEISDRTNAVSVLNNLITAETENRASEDEKVLQYAQSVNEALGNAKTDLQGKIDSEAQTRLTSDNEIKASITSKEDSLKALINSVKNELNGSITTLNNRVNNLPTNYVFDTYESMTNDLLNASNTKYKVGDTLFIKEVNKPDYWVSAILSTKGTYGYYEISIQESKVDLSNYVKISELSRETIEEKFLETVENGTKSFAARSFTATDRNSGIDVNNYTQYVYDGVFFHKNGVQYPIAFPEKDGVFALLSDIPQTLKNPFALTINGKVYDGSSAVSITTETITEHDFVRFWHAGIQIQNDGTGNILRFSAFDTELEEFSPHISCQYDGPQYYWVWKFPQISGTFAMESQIPTKLSQLTNDGNYQTNTSDLKDNTTTFTTASTRSNVASGEKLSVSFGKISKYFNDLKAVAFSGNKKDIGLGNVDNTSDANKPVSNATQQALNLKANASDVYSKTEADTGLNKSLYNLGYYDTMVENSDGTYTITRQTGYLSSNDLLKASYINCNPSNDYICQFSGLLNVSSGDFTFIICNLLQRSWSSSVLNRFYVYNNSIYIKIDGLTTTDAYKQYVAQNNLFFQYKLATSYTEEIIEGQPLITLDQQGSQWLRDEWEKGLNVFDIDTTTIGNGYDYTATASDWVKAIDIPVEPNTTYTASSIISRYAFNHGDIVADYNKNTITTGSDTKTLSLFIYIGSYSGTARTWFSNYMLNKGSIAYPYQPYNSKAHITNYEADFLKSEAERSANLTYATRFTDTSVYLHECIALAPFDYKKGVTYTLSFDTQNKNTYVYYTYTTLGAEYQAVLLDGTRKSFTFTPTKDVPNYVLYVSKKDDDGISTGICSNVMLNIGSTPLPYQLYEGKVVHEKELGEKLNSYVDTSTRQEINALKRFNNGVALKRDDTGIFQTDDGVNLAIKCFGRALHFYGKSGVENYVANAILSFSYSGENNSYEFNFPQKNGTIALTNDFKTINGNSIVGSGDLTITPGIFSLVGNNVDTLTISKNETYFITSVEALPIYVEGNSGISFYGSSLVSTVGLLGGSPRICLNGSAYTLDSNSVTLKSDGLFKAYKVN